MAGSITDAATASLTTYFGSTVHGLSVQWKSSPSTDASGTTELEIVFTEYLKAHLHLFGASADDGSSTVVDRLKAENNDYISYSSVAASDDTEYTAETYGLQYYVAWANPDTSSSLTYDGIQGRLIGKLTTGNAASGTRAFVNVIWDDSAAGVYDISPTTSYDSSDAAQDTSTNDVTVVDPVDDAGEHCTEMWYIADTIMACVEFSGTVKRQRNTGDTTGDIILEYGSYDMHALIGRKDTTDANSDDSLRLAEQTVDLSVLSGSGAKAGYTVLSAAALASIVYTLSF